MLSMGKPSISMAISIANGNFLQFAIEAMARSKCREFFQLEKGYSNHSYVNLCWRVNFSNEKS